MPEAPNFYLLLDLDPAVCDWDAIEERIRAKRDEWSRASQGHQRARAHAQQCLRLLPEIEQCLKDPASRERQAREADRILTERRAAQGAELDELIELIRTGGGPCDRERLNRLAEKFQGIFTREEIEARMRRAGIEIEGDAAEPADPARASDEIDRQVAQEIRRRLDLLGLRDLYELLELRASASPGELRARAAEIYRENRRLGRHDGLATAENELASFCETVFATAGAKAAYDRFLTIETMERLVDRVELAGADGLLTREEMDALIRKAAELGVGEAAARKYLETLARDRGWKVDPGSAPRKAPRPGPSSSTPEPRAPDRRGRFVALLLPYLLLLGRRPAVAVPIGLTVMGMGAVLVASMGAPGTVVAPSPPVEQPSSATAAASVGDQSGDGSGLPGPPVDQENAGGSGPQAPPAPAPFHAPPARPTPVLPPDPRVVVIAVGEQRIGTLVEETVTDALQSAGLEVRDNRGSLGLIQLLESSGGQPSVSQLAHSVAGDGFHVLVLAEIDPLGQRQLNYYGRTSVAMTCRVRLHAYSLADQLSLGRGWTGELEYTQRGAAQQVAKSLRPAGAALADEIAEGWSRKRGALRGGP